MSKTISFLDLNNYQPLDSLTPEDLKEIAEKLKVLELKKGDTVFKEGDKDDDNIFLYKGSIDLVKAGKDLNRVIFPVDDEGSYEFFLNAVVISNGYAKVLESELNKKYPN